MDEMDSYSRARYYFEHRVFRDWFYGADTGEEIIKALLIEGSSFFWDVISRWCKETGNEIEGTKGQYKVSVCTCDKEYTMIRIAMPEPQREPLCHQIYLVFNKDFRRRGYFTVERGVSRKVRYLCSWESGESGRHSNYGRCSSNVFETEKKIACIFTNRKYKSFWRRQEIWQCILAVVFIGAAVALFVERIGQHKVYCRKKSKRRLGK